MRRTAHATAVPMSTEPSATAPPRATARLSALWALLRPVAQPIDRRERWRVVLTEIGRAHV